MAIDHVGLVAVQHPVLAALGGGEADAVEVPTPVVLGDGERADRLTRGMPAGGTSWPTRRPRSARRWPPGHVEKYGAHNSAAHLLEDHDQLDVVKPRRVLLGRRGLETSCSAILAPHAGRSRRSSPSDADLGLGRLVVAGKRRTALRTRLLLAEGEFMRIPLLIRRRGDQTGRPRGDGPRLCHQRCARVTTGAARHRPLRRAYLGYA